MLDAAERFEHAAKERALHTLDGTDFQVSGLKATDAAAAIYKRGMVANKPGRRIYNVIMAAPPHQRCPLCGQGLVRQMDHHLPKERFPALCVVPLNLVPACGDCNHRKGAKTPESAEAALLHPYVDRIDSERWLNARVRHDDDPSLEYFVDPPGSWDPVLSARVQNHFDFFDLARLYATRAAALICDIRRQIARLVSAAGPEEVNAYLADEAETRFAHQLNGWEGVAYKALAADDWFCRGEFLVPRP
ncbi:HNH endonuclease [Kitasatospora sp. NPDC096204]|uniref:HNH endonuclease n=1 Tax=Kitasatospora sp. NPDC096204 TaxID=3364094 RepID=UPI003826C040